MAQEDERPVTAVTPKKIGRYEVRKEIGRGMMGVVYQAHDPTLGRTVALKTISLAFAVSDEDRRSFEKRFLAEARASAALSHPGIVVVYEVGADPDSRLLYIALEYLRGKTLDQLTAQGRLEWRAALGIAGPVAEALHHAHSHGIVHRDIKPANLMVVEAGPKIMDFGVAKLEAGELTAGNRVFGSPSYMSPEQASGERVDSRSDLFSLGAVLYELLTGKRAFPGSDLSAIVMRLFHDDPAPASTFVPGVPEPVDYIVSRALAKPTDRRYPTGKALAEDIHDVLEGRPPRHRREWEPPAAETETVKAKGPIPGPPADEGERTARGEAGGPSLALPAGKRVCLAITAGARQGETFELARPRAVIGRAGRSASVDIEIPDPEISSAHAAVECHGPTFVLRDLGSTNGTFLGEERIGDERLIENHAEFRVGRTRFMLIVSDRD